LPTRLRLTVTAEGVEEATRAARLRALGCDAAQGWYYAWPMPPHEILAMLTQARRIPAQGLPDPQRAAMYGG
jgi:EAL domain-containing protein (putative c-di-GMP-specific phosphodiesterase class I)